MTRLGASLFLRIVLIVIAATVAASVISLAAGYRASVAAQERHIEVLAKTLGEAALEPAYELDVKALRQLAASVLSSEGAVTAMFLDAGGRVLTDGSDENPLRGQQINQPTARHAREFREWATASGKGIVQTAGPIKATAETHLGYVVLAFSTDQLFSSWLTLMRQALLFIAACGGLACGAALLVARRFTRPIDQLAGFAEQARQGTGTQRVPDFGPGDIGKVAAAISEVLEQPQKPKSPRPKFPENF